MFDYDLAHWVFFFSTALLLNLAPGPDIAFILSHTMRSGARAGFGAMLGIWAGATMHAALAVGGLSAIVAASAFWFSVAKWVGVAYLVFAAFGYLQSNPMQLEKASATQSQGFTALFWQGFLIDLLNPKVAIFFLAFLPQFVVPGAGPAWAQMLLHGTLVIAVAALIEPPLILVASKWRHSITRIFSHWVDRGVGVLLLIFAARLAASER